MLYFAYGSNMDWERMLERCPEAQSPMPAALLNYDLQFTRTSQKLGCGTADVIPVQGATVWGVVYHLTEKDCARLDASEGVAINAYKRVDVVVQARGNPSLMVEVFTYVVCTKENPRPKPSRTYLNYLLSGAAKWKLPQDYQERLSKIETLPEDELTKAKTLAREVASRAIKNNPHLWDDLKTRLADCQSVDVYGSMNQMDFLGAVKREVAKLPAAEQALLKKHSAPRPDAPKHITFLDVINGQIFSRAKAAARRM